MTALHSLESTKYLFCVECNRLTWHIRFTKGYVCTRWVKPEDKMDDSTKPLHYRGHTTNTFVPGEFGGDGYIFQIGKDRRDASETETAKSTSQPAKKPV